MVIPFTGGTAMALLGASLQSILAEEFVGRPANPRARVLEVVEELVTRYRLDAVELFLDGIFILPEVIDRALLDEIGRLQTRLGMTLTAHLPYAWVDLSSANELARAAAVEAVVRAIEQCGTIDVFSYVLHATGPFANEVAAGLLDPRHSLWVPLMLRSIERSFDDLRQRLPNAPLAVETLEGFPFAWQAPLVERFGLDVCCDVAHLVVRGDDPFAFIETWLPRIRQFHIHGVREQVIGPNTRRRIDHQALGGSGELVDARRLFSLLDARGFQGPVVLENLTRVDFEASVATLRQAAGRDV